MLCTETVDEVRESQSLSTAELEERGRDLLPLGAEDINLALESTGPLCPNPPVLLWSGRADTVLLSERSSLCLVACISYNFFAVYC